MPDTSATRNVTQSGIRREDGYQGKTSYDGRLYCKTLESSLYHTEVMNENMGIQEVSIALYTSTLQVECRNNIRVMNKVGVGRQGVKK